MTTKQEKPKTAVEVIAEIKGSENITDLEAIFNGDSRKSVIAAYESKLSELNVTVEDTQSKEELEEVKEEHSEIKEETSEEQEKPKDKSKPKTKVMAVFFTRAANTSWLKIGEGEGGSIADVHMNYFSYPLSQTKTGSIIFEDGSILDCLKREFRSQKDVDLVKSLIKSIK